MKFKYVIILLVALFLVGCKKEQPEIITQDANIYLDDYLDINLPSEMNLERVKWHNGNLDIIYFESALRIVGINEGNAILTATDGKLVFVLNVQVIDKLKIKNEIDELVNIIRKDVKIVDDKLKLVNEVEGYDFEIAYVSNNPEVLPLDGSFVRGLFDQYVNLNTTLIYKGITRTFIVPIKIDMIPHSEQKALIEEFISENVKDIVASESGQLPTYLEIYDLKIDWLANVSGVIDANKKLYKAYEAGNVILHALYKIAGKDQSMEIKYRSAGLAENEKADYIDRVLKDIIPSEAGKWLNTTYEKDLEIIKDFIYPDSVTQLRPGNGKNGTKMPGGPQYIVIHDSGMTNVGDNAEGLNTFIHNNANTVGGRVASWHFSVDQEEIYQHVPTDEIAWHAGDGGVAFGSTYINSTSKIECIGGGNSNGIGIETCINPGNDYELTLKRTAKLTASLLHQYGLGLDRIKQHFNFSGKQCPNVIRSSDGMWESFLRDVEIAYFLMKLDKSYEVSWEISHPEIVKESGLIITPINDTEVGLNLTLTANNQVKTYNFKTLIKGLPMEVKLSNVFYDLYINAIPRTVNGDIVLPLENSKYNAQIFWTSNKPNIISNAGKYTKPSEKQIVGLTAEIVIGKDELIRTINVTVE